MFTKFVSSVAAGFPDIANAAISMYNTMFENASNDAIAAVTAKVGENEFKRPQEDIYGTSENVENEAIPGEIPNGEDDMENVLVAAKLDEMASAEPEPQPEIPAFDSPMADVPEDDGEDFGDDIFDGEFSEVLDEF